MAPLISTERWKVWLIKFNRLKERRFFKYTVPFFVLVFGGSFYLKEFTSLRYQYKRNVFIRPEDIEKTGKVMKKPGEVTLESEFEKIKQLDIDNWENVRIYRPWEDPAKTIDK